MEMHQVRYFLAVGETLHVTSAAERCNVAQPSLTRALQKLEEELGGQLFRRERSRTHLTQGLAPIVGRELTVYWLDGYGGGVFLPFKDGSAGQSTYGGGRYVLDSIKGADLGLSPDGRMCVDFNFAYNPSCAYSDRWVCPLAPVANHLSATIKVGEKHPDALLSHSAA